MVDNSRSNQRYFIECGSTGESTVDAGKYQCLANSS